MNKTRILALGILTLAIGISGGCVAIRDSIPIMGESADGTHVVAYATRTRGYFWAKAAEKIELWSVNSADGVTMTGSSADSDSTASIQMGREGIALAQRALGGPAAQAPPQEQQINALRQPAVQPYPCRPGDPDCSPDDGGGTGN